LIFLAQTLLGNRTQKRFKLDTEKRKKIRENIRRATFGN
jgi:hypothetical protein